MADVGGLIGIDAGVLDQNLAGKGRRPRLFVGSQGRGRSSRLSRALI